MTVATQFEWLSQLATPLLVLAGLAALAGWVLLFRLRKRWLETPAPDFGSAAPSAPLAGWVLTCLRLALGLIACWTLLEAMGRWLVAATTWPMWIIAALTALLVEALIWLYRLERRIVSRRLGITLTGLRLALLALIAVMLAQPVWASVWSQSRKRTVAILLDRSASMKVADKQLPAHAKLRLAEAFSLPAARRAYRLDDQAQQLAELRNNLLRELAWMDRLAGQKKDTISAELTHRRKALNSKLTDCQKSLAAQAAPIESALAELASLPVEAKTALMEAKAALAKNARNRLDDAIKWTSTKDAPELVDKFEVNREALHRVVTELDSARALLEKTADQLDDLMYAQLKPADKAAIDAIAALTREQLSQAALVHTPRQMDKDGKPGKPGESLLERLDKQYNVKVYSFAADLAELSTKDWTDPVATILSTSQPVAAPATTSSGPIILNDESPVKGPTTRPADPSMRTDLPAAMKKVTADLGGEELAGMLVFSDGQDNGKGNAEPLAKQMGGLGSSFCAALLGSKVKPPTDAAIISVDAPDTLFLSDRLYVDTQVKLDGLADKDVRITLYDNKLPVDTKTIHVPAELFRTRVQLADEPNKIGLHAYRVELEECKDEVFKENNSYDLALSVTDDKTKVLLVDYKPRWEYRYLKNLFTGRDKTVRIQYVLTSPDSFAGQTTRPAIHASVDRPDGQDEATLLPANEAEWMKFDLVILGDLPAGQWSEQDIKGLRRFVTDRGGSLVIVAGRQAMPAEYVDSPLADLIPVQLAESAQNNDAESEEEEPAPAAGTPAAAPKPRPGRKAVRANPAQPPGSAIKQGLTPEGIFKDGFALTPTSEGKEHVVLRQHVDLDKSLEVWQSFPPLYWHSRYTVASPSALVLAYALDPRSPKWLTGEGETPTTAASPDVLAKMRQEYYRRHALVLSATHGLGKVMMLSFDQTWRLRYRQGDTYHHKFWGQVIRWATAGKLPAGTTLVKLGSDKTRYLPHDRPEVRAKLLRADFSPLISDQVAVKVFSGNKLLAKVPMRYLKDSPGLYTAVLDELPPGSYKLELDAPPAAELLAKEGATSVSTEISIDPASPTELVELAANPGLLTRLAGLSHNGIVVGVEKAPRMLEVLPTGKVTVERRQQYDLWDSWPLLVLFCLLASLEWVLRKRAGLV